METGHIKPLAEINEIVSWYMQIYMATVNQSDKYLLLPLAHPCKNITYQMTFLYN